MYKQYVYKNLTFAEMIKKRQVFLGYQQLLSRNHPDKQIEFTTKLNKAEDTLILKVWIGNLN